MRSKFPFGLLLLLGLCFVGFGDRVLPSSIGRYSFQVRNTLDQLLISAFPTWKPKTAPHQRTEEAVENLRK